MKHLKLDEYNIFARYIPGIVTIVPFFILWYFLRFDLELLNLEKYLQTIRIAGSITIFAMVVYINSMLIRQIAKYFENKYFIEKDGFPTTYLMTYKDTTYSRDYKKNYRINVKRQFNILLLNENEEEKNFKEAERLLNEATKQIILSLKNGYLVKKYNIWYGFIRNLIGGIVIGICICGINIVLGFFINIKLSEISAAILIIYFIIFMFKKTIIQSNAEAYAKQLHSEYMYSQN